MGLQTLGGRNDATSMLQNQVVTLCVSAYDLKILLRVAKMCILTNNFKKEIAKLFFSEKLHPEYMHF